MPPDPPSHPPPSTAAPVLSRRDFVRAAAAAGAAVGLGPWVVGLRSAPASQPLHVVRLHRPGDRPRVRAGDGDPRDGGHLREQRGDARQAASPARRATTSSSPPATSFPRWWTPGCCCRSRRVRSPTSTTSRRCSRARRPIRIPTMPCPTSGGPPESRGGATRSPPRPTPGGCSSTRRYAGTMTMMDDAPGGARRDAALSRPLGQLDRSRRNSRQAKADALAARAESAGLHLLAGAGPDRGGRRLGRSDVEWRRCPGGGGGARDRLPRAPGRVRSIWMDTHGHSLQRAERPSKRSSFSTTCSGRKSRPATPPSPATAPPTPREPPSWPSPCPIPRPRRLTRLEFYRDLGEETQLYYQIWTEVKAA